MCDAKGLKVPPVSIHVPIHPVGSPDFLFVDAARPRASPSSWSSPTTNHQHTELDMNIPALGAHPDDVEFLCAGTLLKYHQEGRAGRSAW
jgi:hypothetical protein